MTPPVKSREWVTIWVIFLLIFIFGVAYELGLFSGVSL